MLSYTTTPADRRPLPEAWHSEPRYLGYRDVDRAKPWAHYMQERSLPPQPHIHDAIATGAVASELGVRLPDLADHLAKPGYRHLETGWTVNPDGHLVVAIHTDMPGVTGEMWDWWFGWHSTDSSRYKLWHPEAHQFARLGEDRSGDRAATDRQKYQNNVSYVSEYIGGTSEPIAIRFLDPEKTALGVGGAGETTILIRGGSPKAPIAITWLVHQIRRTDSGSEMRTRFIVNDFAMLDLPPHSVDGPARVLTSGGLSKLAGIVLPHVVKIKALDFAPAMIQHCGQEMNHLASFLPKLHEEFKDLP